MIGASWMGPWQMTWGHVTIPAPRVLTARGGQPKASGYVKFLLEKEWMARLFVHKRGFS